MKTKMERRWSISSLRAPDEHCRPPSAGGLSRAVWLAEPSGALMTFPRCRHRKKAAVVPVWKHIAMRINTHQSVAKEFTCLCCRATSRVMIGSQFDGNCACHGSARSITGSGSCARSSAWMLPAASPSHCSSSTTIGDTVSSSGSSTSIAICSFRETIGCEFKGLLIIDHK